MKGYVARRELDKVHVYVVQTNAERQIERHDLKHVMIHSPDGFEWGYRGSGPADLALSILADFFGENPNQAELDQGRYDNVVESLRYYQRFKEAFVAKWPKEGGYIEDHTIGVWIRKVEST